MRKSLKASHSLLAQAGEQLRFLEKSPGSDTMLIPFQEKLLQSGLFPLKPLQPEILQLNIGKMCNQVCRHCHVDAGPDRKEIMTRDIMELCLGLIDRTPAVRIVDITGGAPEMNPEFRWLVNELTQRKLHVIIRCNLTIILANKKYHDLPAFYAMHQVEIVSSLPFYASDRTDKQRGDGVFDSSIKALQLLNEVGYGMPGSPLELNLVYNPAGAFLPPEQASLERLYKEELRKKHNISFHQLFTITNMPINRYLNYLLESGNYEAYMAKLTAAYNPAAAANVMCRNTISVGWDGFLYDCDFNQMLELKIDAKANHVSDVNITEITNREIRIGQHCFGCTAGAGSSCGGAVV